MQHDQSHAIQDVLLHTVYDVILHFVVKDMSPPDQNIGLVQYVLAETVIWFVKSSRADDKAAFPQCARDHIVHPVRVNLLHFVMSLFVSVFIPYGNAQRTSHYFFSLSTGSVSIRTTAPFFAAEALIASQRRAIRKPISGGEGLSIWPLRTARNCCHVPIDGATGTG